MVTRFVERGDMPVNKQSRIVLCTITIVLLCTISSWASRIQYPTAIGYVNDFANVMDQRSKAEIQVVAEKLRSEQGIEMAVVTVKSTAPLDPKEYITGLFEAWGVGGPEDSGLLILLSIDEGAIEVEPGYGLEGALPDGKIGAIIDQTAIPYFVNREYGKGLSNLAQAFQASLAGEEFTLPEEKKSGSGDWFVAFIIFVLIVILLRRNRNYPPGGTAGGGGGGTRTTRRTVVVRSPRIPSGGRRSGGGSSRGGGSFGGFGGGRSGGGGAGRRF